MSAAIDQTVEPQSASYREAEALFRQTLNRINNPSAAERLWNRHFLAHEREALGGNLREAVNRHGTPIRLWANVRDVSEQRAVLEVGEALNFLSSSDVEFLLREGGELPRDPAAAQAAAIERGDLVLTRLPREAYWQGELIDVDWQKHVASWEFLMIAAERRSPESRSTTSASAHQKILMSTSSQRKSTGLSRSTASRAV